jgi:hypothetical protein
MALSKIGEAAVVGSITSGTFISLHTALPNDGGSNEVSGAGYARAASVFGYGAEGNPTIASNTEIVQFGVANEAWGTVTHFGLWTSKTGGSYLGGSFLNFSKAVFVNDMPVFPINELKIKAD